MKISYQWLREWVPGRLAAKPLADRLTQAGLEVVSIAAAAPPLGGVVVGEVVSVDAHPSADQLKLCRVRVGRQRTLEVVCGASNVVAGLHAPVALPGARLPGGVVVAATEIRGVRSYGMLCSEEELGLAESSGGLLDLGSEATIGEALERALGLEDEVIEIDLTPNRGDCLSVLGIAREVAALTGAKLRSREAKAARVASSRRVKVTIDAVRDCPRYAGRVIDGISTAARTPLWMRERLRRGGVRSLHPVVDVTNYVMLELGQPMHAFDLECLRGNIHVRRATARDQITLLDGKVIETTPDMLLVADGDGPLALAGVMGGARSGVTESTRALFLESAYFRAGAISGTARALGLQTESSQRFERGVDYALQRRALERATELLLAIVGGKAGPVVESQSMRFLPKPRALRLRASRVTRILGVALKRQESEKILRPLGMRVARAGVDLRVTPPSYRFDVQREEDVIEELARLHGYERLPARLPAALLAARPVSESVLSMSRLRRLLVDRDYHEVITYSFVDPALARMLDPAEEPIILANPIAADMAAMRTSLWPGLIQALRYNRNRQQARVRLFEIGRRFRQRSEAPVEDVVLAGVAVGSALPTQWGSAAREMDFFDAKGDVEALLSLTGRPYELSPAAHPALHPGQTAAISLDGRSVGMLGMLHPEIRAELGLEGAVYLFELGTAEGFIARLPSFGETSKFPSIRRDLAVIVPESVEARLVLATAARVAGKLLVNLELFDQYRGKGIDSGRKSLALGLTLQDSSRTLKDDEVEALIAKIVSTLESELGAQLRR